MERHHVLTAALGLLLIAACTEGAAVPSAEVSPTATGAATAAAPATFVSERYGYAVELPDDSWHVTEFAGTWDLGEFVQQDGPGVDLFQRRNPTGEVMPGLYVYLAAQPIPDGLSFDDWVAGQDDASRREEPCFFPGTSESAEVSGVSARFTTYTCPDWRGGGRWEVVESMSIHDGRGFAIYVFPGWVGEYDMSVDELQAAAAEWLARFSIAAG